MEVFCSHLIKQHAKLPYVRCECSAASPDIFNPRKEPGQNNRAQRLFGQQGRSETFPFSPVVLWPVFLLPSL
jgi:hypothetical protein